MPEPKESQSDPNDPIWTNPVIREWQSKIDSNIAEINDANDRVYELYITSSDEFRKAIDKTRKKLKVEPLDKFDLVFDIKNWADENIVVDINSKSETPLNYFFEVINSAVDEIGLPRTWRDTFAHYVITDKKPNITWVSSKRKVVRVKDIDDDSITVKFSKGVRQEEYQAIWSRISEYLGPAKRQTKLPDKDKRARDIEMYLKRKSGMKFSELAKQYFSDDSVWAIDAAKKAVKRQRDLYEKGINLAD